MRGVGVHIAAAIRAEHFDRDLRSHRSLHDGLVGDDLILHHRISSFVENWFAIRVGFRDGNCHRLQQLRLGVRIEILNDALRHEHHGEHDAQRQQQIIRRADEVHPEIAERRHRMPRDAAHERRRQRDARGRRAKVVDDQRDHLREIGHRGFAGVALPIRVRGETDSSVEREIRRQRAKALRIQRQMILQPQDRVSENAAHRAEQQHRDGVLFPILFALGVHAHEAIGDFFQRLENRVKPRPAFHVQNLAEKQAHRFGDEREQRDEQAELQPVN